MGYPFMMSRAIYQTIGEDDCPPEFYIFQLVFQGILICQLLYVFFSG